MLPKINRLDANSVEKVFKNGSFISLPSFTFKFLPSLGTIPRISVIAPKSVAKLAVKRNMLRRLGYTQLEPYLSKFPPLLGVLVFKKFQDDPLIIENDIQAILRKIN
jgi:ribonuclease P protein component